MTLAGGAAAKFGNRFEKLWTLSELARMLRGETDSLRIEPPGMAGVEFVVQAGAQQEFHQAKRSHPNGKWSITTLAKVGVLKTIDERIRDESHRFVFVSGSDAPQLRDLSHAAASAESHDEFSRKFLAAETRAAPHRQLLQRWKCSELDAWGMLRRVEVRTIDDYELETKVKSGLALLYMDSASAQDRLSTIVDGAVHRTIERDDLIRALEKDGHALRLIPSNASYAVAEATDRYLAGARRNLIQGSSIPRKEVAAVVSRLTGDGASDCVLTGRAGMGKTACVAEIVGELRQAGRHVLAFRLDRHMAATSTRDLGRRLDLEESPTLVLDAAAKADRKPAVLIVDQLDAVSAMSGRSSEVFDVVERLLFEAQPANIRTLIVCRSFDWQHDPRLRRLLRDDGQRIDLGELSPRDVHAVLSREHLDSSRLTDRQFKLLRLPQNLSLFLHSGHGKSTTPSFRTATDLFDGYWGFKRGMVEQRTLDASGQWLEVMRTMCDEMTRTRQLSVRREKLDRFSDDYLDQYVSENVLTRDVDTYGFGHESFFDYCFARLFAFGDNSVADVLKSSEQHLFRRAQVRQVLEYLRDKDFQRYVGEVRDLVSDGEIRTHIKDLIFALVAGVDDPRDEEWELWMDWVREAWKALERDVAPRPDLARRAWERLRRAMSWFRKLDDHGVIKSWLEEGNTQQTDAAVIYLSWQIMSVDHRDAAEQEDERLGRVADLLEPYADRSGQWPVYFREFMVGSRFPHSRRLFNLFLKLVDNGTFDGHDDRGRRLWAECRELADHRPGWVSEVIAHQLRRCIARSNAEPEEDRADAAWCEDLNSDVGANEALRRSAACTPRAFVDHVLTPVLETSEAASRADVAPPIRDEVWPYLIKNDLSTGSSCLEALADALAALADKGDDLRGEINSLSASRSYVANRLLLALYCGSATRFADEAMLAFCDEPWRFDSGYSDSPYWLAKETIKASVRHCSPANRKKLESAILSYVAPYERTKEGVRHRGWASYNLLDALPRELRSIDANRRFDELERKFEQPPYSAPKGLYSIFDPPPISCEADDEQWLNAIAAYPSSESRDWSKRDAVQVASDLGRCAAKEPERFAKIGLQLPSTTNPAYFSELLRGLADGSVDDTARIQVSQRTFECARDQCGGDIADFLAGVSGPLPDDALQMLVSLATESDDTNEEAWQQIASSGQPYYRDDIYANGIDTTRGRAARAMAQLIQKDASYVQRFGTTLDELASDGRPAVASCVAMALRTVAYHDAERGLSLFQRMDFSEERLLATRHVYAFMRENLWDGFAELEDVLLRTLRSAHADVRQAGARLVCMAGLHRDDARLANEALRGDVYHRRGVAEVASANVGDGAHREWCETSLRVLFSDSDAEVRKCAASCFSHIGEDRIDAYGDLIEAFCASPAFEEGPFFLVDALKNARSQLPGAVHLVCKSFLDRLSSQDRDFRERFHANGDTVVELVFRLYQNHQKDQCISSLALDLIDRACLELDGATKGFEDFER